jgi:hypothetical protein
MSGGAGDLPDGPMAADFHVGRREGWVFLSYLNDVILSKRILSNLFPFETKLL